VIPEKVLLVNVISFETLCQKIKPLKSGAVKKITGKEKRRGNDRGCL
jgi:hypothetical protein